MKYIFDKAYPVTQKFLEVNSAYKSGVHMGTDYACPVGTLIYAPLDGKIVQTFDNNPSMGNCIIYECKNEGKTYQLRFMHLSACYPVGEYKEGDVIGVTGNTGMSTGPHLHVDVTIGPVQWSAMKTKDGVMFYMTDFEVWNQDDTFHKASNETPKQSGLTTTTKLNKEEAISFFNTFITIFVTVALPQLSTFDFDNASKASLIALGGSILRMFVKALVQKYTK